MSTNVTLDRAGRISLPKPLRDEMNLEPGDKLHIESRGETITLHPVRAKVPIRRENGILVYRTGKRASIPIRGLIEQDRADRYLKTLGLNR